MDKTKWPAKSVFPIARPGYKFILMAILITGMLFYLGWTPAAWVSFAVFIFVCSFFRDPERHIPVGENLLVSPADGKVIRIEQLENSPYLDAPCTKVSIFMNVFNVHVNRVPFGGRVQKVIYHPGKFMNASFDKASEHNERNALVIETPDRGSLAVVQVAGLIARRIVNCVKEGDTIEKGERYGMIQFGSRLDLYLPGNFEVTVKLGEKTRAGTTIIGTLN